MTLGAKVMVKVDVQDSKLEVKIVSEKQKKFSVHKL